MFPSGRCRSPDGVGRLTGIRRVAVASIAACLLAACTGSPSPTEEDCAEQQEVVRDSGLVWTDLTCGDGEEAVGGAAVTVAHVGRFEDGEIFDSSRGTQEPFTFLLGAGRVIAGWEEGIRGMRVGGTRRLLVPPDLAYGREGFAGVIPPGATLTFEVELLEVRLPER